MTKCNGTARARFAPSVLSAAMAIGWVAGASAVEIDVGNPDLKVRWDNTVRYNLGFRVEKQDGRLLASPSYDESDSKFKRGQVVTNRIDLFSELDVNYRSQIGARISAAGWYDQAYHDNSVRAPAQNGAFQTSYFNDRYNSVTKRYVNGPSGEILDGFGWANFKLGEVPTNVKVGRHTVVWGEGLLIGGHAISYSQAPVDGVKAVTSPGIETKEVFLPLGQISFKTQATSSLSLFGQYFYEWEPTRVPHGGTYLMGADTDPGVDRLPAAPGFSLIKTDPYKPKQGGNWGVGARYNAEAIESTLGAYYRRFDDYQPETGIQVLGARGPFRFNYARGVDLYGLSFARAIGPVSFGSDVSLRKNGHLNSKTTYGPTENTGARGDTVHVVLNGIYLLPKTPVWDTGSLIVELAYSHLVKVTANPSLYRGVGYAAAACAKTGTGTSAANPLQPGDKTDACSTRNYYQMAVNFTPQYLNILPAWDLDLPVSINYGIHGNAPTGGGGFENVLAWSVGARMTYSQRYEFSLRYADLKVPTKYSDAIATGAGGGTVVTALGGRALGSAVGATDRGWLAFTFKTSF